MRCDVHFVFAVFFLFCSRCGTVFPEGHKLHDPEFLAATGGTITCHPMYHQVSVGVSVSQCCFIDYVDDAAF